MAHCGWFLTILQAFLPIRLPDRRAKHLLQFLTGRLAPIPPVPIERKLPDADCPTWSGIAQSFHLYIPAVDHADRSPGNQPQNADDPS